MTVVVRSAVTGPDSSRVSRYQFTEVLYQATDKPDTPPSHIMLTPVLL